MKVKGIVDIDFSNYKKPSLYIAFPHCNFKCGKAHCQNSQLVTEDNYDILTSKVVNMFDANPVTQAVVCGGLEPFDSWFDLQVFIMNFRHRHPHEIVIYTGYTEEEVADKIEWLKSYENIIIKFGRYIPNRTPHFDKNLGVMLVSDNQYSKIYNGMEGYC